MILVAVLGGLVIEYQYKQGGETMAVYIAKYDGYIADNPNIDFERCDGTVFPYYEVNTASMSNTANVQTITGGQGNYPLAYIETDKSLEFTFASSQFTMDMFTMANATNLVEGDVGTQETKRYDVATSLLITLPFEVQTGSVKIRGLQEATGQNAAVATGKFTVTITAATEIASGSTVIKLHEGDATVGDTIRVSYRRRVIDAQRVTVTTKSTTSKGALYAHWPVYSSGTDCTESSIKGWLHLYIPRVRVTALPGFDNSYKSAGTNSVTFAAIDPKRADEKMYELAYESLGTDGSIVSKGSGDVTWN